VKCANHKAGSGLGVHRPHHTALDSVRTIHEWLGEMVDSEADGSWHFPPAAARDFRGRLAELLVHLRAMRDDEGLVLLQVLDRESDAGILAAEADRLCVYQILEELVELAGCHERPATTWAEVERTFCRFASSLDVYVAKRSVAEVQAGAQDGERRQSRRAK
jgi:hypothetical protein